MGHFKEQHQEETTCTTPQGEEYTDIFVKKPVKWITEADKHGKDAWNNKLMDFSEDTPLGGGIERHDIEKEKELIEK